MPQRHGACRCPPPPRLGRPVVTVSPVCLRGISVVRAVSHEDENEDENEELPEYLRRVKWVPKKPLGPPASPTSAQNSKGKYRFQPAKDVRRALGVDYGRVHIGVAVSNLGIAPRPLQFIRGGGIVELMRMANDVVDVAVAEQCDCIVVGLPVTSTGSLYKRATDSQQGRRCRNFAHTVFTVSEKHSIGVFLVDERGTSQEAGALLDILGGSGNKRKGTKGTKGRKDSVAAALILSAFYKDPAAALRVRNR
jgi:putative transcription antitermination factor YqgF